MLVFFTSGAGLISRILATQMIMIANTMIPKTMFVFRYPRAWSPCPSLAISHSAMDAEVREPKLEKIVLEVTILVRSTGSGLRAGRIDPMGMFTRV